MGQHCAIEHTQDGFAIVDENSKNGTFVNQISCVPKTCNRVKNGDAVLLGANDAVNAVNLRVKLSSCAGLADFSFEPIAEAFIDRSKLDTLWPDHALALQTKLVCAKNNCVLLLDKQSLEFSLVSDKDKVDKQQYDKICSITLGKASFISPISEGKSLSIDGIEVLGEVPLILPCVIQFAGSTIELNPYDGLSLRYAQKSIAELSSF
jgi:hypothetical protein